jgi:alkanesulfonate monooxygenase SsuD/methylene tetrahydromethanopterin reductase-like flavin-dependent oxidoreductase (luciferase family)
VKTHWPKYVEGCERVGRKPDPANWRVAKSIFVADDDATARAYVADPDKIPCCFAKIPCSFKKIPCSVA